MTSPRPTLLVLHCPAGGGHKAAARAVAEAARARGVAAEVRDALELTPAWFSRSYVDAHLGTTSHVPELYGSFYRAFDRRNALAELRSALDRRVGRRLLDLCRELQPTAVVATHFFPLAVLGRARLRGLLETPVVGVVTDYAAHAFWAEPGVDRLCAPAGRAPRDLVRHGFAPEAIVATGIPVRAELAQAPVFTMPPAAAPLEVLVTSGGFGVGPMAETLRSFAGIAGLRITVVCGDNPERVAQARAVASAAGLDAEVLGFVTDMPARLGRAHLLVGKPGGLTASEALAAGRPMVIVGACPGQESKNEAWLVENGAALASEAACAGPLVAALRAAGALGTMAAAARALGAPRAAERVVNVALRLAHAGAGLGIERAA